MIFWLFLAIVMAQEAEVVDTKQGIAEEVDDCKDKVQNLRDMVSGLELFLQDKLDHKNKCPDVEWEQPPFKEYKKNPKSYLPDACQVIITD
tara:strand:+ start:24 stop:296 length:273 start_codon:yes stop_codon:yes gene_type:complete